MSDNEFKRCTTCGEYDWSNRHKCPPIFLVRLRDGNDDDSIEIRARDHQQAAEKFCEFYDRNGEYSIMHQGEVAVVSWRSGIPKDRRIFKVVAQMVPEYWAHPILTPDDIETFTKP